MALRLIAQNEKMIVDVLDARDEDAESKWPLRSDISDEQTKQRKQRHLAYILLQLERNLRNLAKTNPKSHQTRQKKYADLLLKGYEMGVADIRYDKKEDLLVAYRTLGHIRRSRGSNRSTGATNCFGLSEAVVKRTHGSRSFQIRVWEHL